MVIGGRPDLRRPARGSEVALATTVRRTVLTLPAAATGPENPLPALRPLDEMHVVDDRDRAGLPRDMARQLGHAPLATVLPVRILDGYGRERTPTDLDAIVIENDRLRATVLPGLGGRIHSLFHKPTGRDLVYTNPVLQPLPTSRSTAPGSPVASNGTSARRATPHCPAPRCTPPVSRHPTAARWSGSGSGSGCATCRSRSICGCRRTPTSFMWAYGYATRTNTPHPSTGGPTSPFRRANAPGCWRPPMRPGTSGTSGH